MATRSFEADLATVLEECFAFPKHVEQPFSPAPLDTETISQELYDNLSDPDQFHKIDYQITGNQQSHFKAAINCLQKTLARSFYYRREVLDKEDEAAIYQRRQAAEDGLDLALDQPQIVSLQGTAGSGKSTIVGHLINEGRRCYVYVNCAKKTRLIFENVEDINSNVYSIKPIPPVSKAILISNLCSLIANQFDLMTAGRSGQCRVSRTDLIRRVPLVYMDKQVVIIFDDVDALPISVQQEVMQLAIELSREEDELAEGYGRYRVLVCQRFSNASRSIQAGSFADPTADIKLCPRDIDPREDEHVIAPHELMELFLNRVRMLAKCKPVEVYFKLHHNAAFEYYFPVGFASIENLPKVHIRYLIDGCELFKMSNYSIRACALSLAALIVKILIDAYEPIDKKEILRSSSPNALRLRLKNALLSEAIEPTIGSAPYPHVLEQQIQLDHPQVRISLEFRALEILYYAQAKDYGGDRGMSYGNLSRVIGNLYENVFSQDATENQAKVDQRLLRLAEYPVYGDPLCILGPSTESLDEKKVEIMPSGKYYAIRFSSYTYVLAKSFHALSRRKWDGGGKGGIVLAVKAINDIIATSLEDDVRSLLHASRWFAPLRSVAENHYVIRAITSTSAYVQDYNDQAEQSARFTQQELHALRRELSVLEVQAQRILHMVT